MKIWKKKQISICQNIIQIFHEGKRPVTFLCLSYIIGISSLLLANFNYIDDLGRTLTGYRAWRPASRFVSEYLSVFIHADKYLTDISPLPQILAAVILGIASFIVLFVFSRGKPLTFWNLIAVLPLGLSPYFLECFSYKFDSPYMALSILVSVFPFLFIEYDRILYASVSVVCAVAMCTTYQAASGIFPMMALFYCWQSWNRFKDKKAALDLIVSACAYLAGVLFFKIFLMIPITGNYVSNSIFSFSDLPAGFAKNLYVFFSRVYMEFNRTWLLLLGFLCLSFLYVALRDTKLNKLPAFVAAVCTLFAACGLTFGLYPALTAPLILPRSMYGFGALIAFIAVLVSFADRVFLSKLACFALSWCFFTFSFTYGNALAEQKRYTDFRVQLALEDLNQLEIMITDDEKLVQINGDIGKSPVVDNMSSHFPILSSLVPNTFAGGWYWSQIYFYKYFKLKHVSKSMTDLSTLDLPIVVDTMYHSIYASGEYILIELK